MFMGISSVLDWDDHFAPIDHLGGNEFQLQPPFRILEAIYDTDDIRLLKTNLPNGTSNLYSWVLT
jgi:hypothetical protein